MKLAHFPLKLHVHRYNTVAVMHTYTYILRNVLIDENTNKSIASTFYCPSHIQNQFQIQYTISSEPFTTYNYRLESPKTPVTSLHQEVNPAVLAALTSELHFTTISHSPICHMKSYPKIPYRSKWFITETFPLVVRYQSPACVLPLLRLAPVT